MSTPLVSVKSVVGQGSESIRVEFLGGSVRLARRGGQEIFVPAHLVSALVAALGALDTGRAVVR